MLNLPPTILPEEIAKLLKVNPQFIRGAVLNGSMTGFFVKNNRTEYKIPRYKFYQDMGWITDEMIIEAYKRAGVELKEKATATTVTKQN
jgi:predicted transcriptional regulator